MSASAITGYDVIGDVHGHADKLEGLLRQMGYSERKGAWRHPERQVVFIGDLIDGGTDQPRTVDLARSMVDAGSAKIVLGNHEFNAIAWATPNLEVGGEFLRPHLGDVGERNRDQHKDFLTAVGDDSAKHRDYIEWFRSIPLWLELDGLRLVHACWNTAAMEVLEPLLSACGSVTDELMVEGSRKGSAAYEAVETVLKGPEIELPKGFCYLDNRKNCRCRARLRWWDSTATTLREAAEISPSAKTRDGQPFPELPDTPLGDGVNAPYTGDVPVLFGHCWRTGTHEVQTRKSACVDYSAGHGKPLVAYRWNKGERDLSADKFVAFPLI